MKVYLASLATDNCELETKIYKTFSNVLIYIHEKLKSLTMESVKDCDFFDRDYVQKYFTEDFFKQFKNINCRTTHGEFIIKKVKHNKYQFIFNISKENCFFICELEILDLLD